MTVQASTKITPDVLRRGENISLKLQNWCMRDFDTFKDFRIGVGIEG
jgi:hypothetical protein